MINYHKNIYLYGAFIYVFTFDLHNNCMRLADLSCIITCHGIKKKGGAYFTGNKTTA